MTKPTLAPDTIASAQGGWDGVVDNNFLLIKSMMEESPWPIASFPNESDLISILAASEESIAIARNDASVSGLPNRLLFHNSLFFASLIDDYNAIEIQTGQTWIDGRQIWRKTFVANLPTGTGTANTAHTITFDPLAMIRMWGVVTDGSRTISIPGPIGSSTQIGLEIDSTNIKVIGYGGGLSGFAGLVVLDYCKP